ncbi:hypothetical protein AX14_007906, partial [Amanita brunnescens Koide BX004]
MSAPDQPQSQVDAAAMDYLLIEAVSALRNSAAVATARAQLIQFEMVTAGILPPPPPAKEPKETPRDSMTSISSKTASKIQPADDEEEALRARLEAIGMH